MPSFSERYGYTPVEKAFQRERVSSDLRTSLWNVLNLCIWNRWEWCDFEWTPDSERINDLLCNLWLNYLKKDFDALPEFRYRQNSRDGYGILKDYFSRCIWYEVFNFIEFLAKTQNSFITAKVRKRINDALELENSVYRLVDTEFIEITDKSQIDAIQNALEKAPPPVQEHLRAALTLLSDKESPDYRNSIKESISAVEAACREVAGQPKATLGDALKKIPNLHPALQKAFSSLYGYTNDADGIRHALLEESTLIKADATFILVVCSAFIGFLGGKSNTEV